MQNRFAVAPTIKTAEIEIDDASAVGKLFVEGEAAGGVLESLFSTVPKENSGVTLMEGVKIGRITPTRYRILTDQTQRIIDRIDSAPQFVTATDLSDGEAGVRISGDGAATLLSHLCGLNFAPDTFPVNTVKISSFAKIRTTIWHLQDGYQLFFGRSYADYIESVLQETVRLLD